MVEEASSRRSKSSLSIQPPTSLQGAEVHRYEVPMCSVCSLWLPDGLTPASSSFLYSIMPGSPGTNEQFSECQREREWALLHTSENGFSPSPEERKVRWGWKRGKTCCHPQGLAPSTALRPSQQGFCSWSVPSKLIFSNSPVNWLFSTGNFCETQ